MNKKNAQQLLLLPEDIIMEGHSMHLDQTPHNQNNIIQDDLENMIPHDFDLKLFDPGFNPVLLPPVLGSVPHYQQEAMEELDQASTTSTEDINKFLADKTPDRDGLSPEAGA